MEIEPLTAGTADVKGGGTSCDTEAAAGSTRTAGMAVVCDGARADLFSASFAGIAATVAETLRVLFSSRFWTRGIDSADVGGGGIEELGPA